MDIKTCLEVMTETTPSIVINAIEAAGVDITKPLNIKQLMEISDYMSLFRTTKLAGMTNHPSAQVGKD